MTPEQASRLSIAEQHDWFRRSGAGGSTLRSSPTLLTSFDGQVGRHLAPFGRHIAFGADPCTGMSVAWQVAAPVRDPFVRIGESAADLGGRIEAEVRSLATPASVVTPVGSVSPHAPATIQQHFLHATITGLEPGKTYYYAVGHQGWDVAGAARLGSFRTAAAGRSPFTFTAFGDQGISYDAVSTANLILAQDPAFHLHAGDVSYANGSGSGLLTDAYDPRVWDGYFEEIEPAASSIPWQVAVGNHELEPWYSADGYGGQHARFDFPRQPGAAGPGTYYAFSYGNVGIVSLDANDVSYEIPANLGYTGGAQVAWLRGTLAAMRTDPGIDFIVAYFHHCAYSTCTSHGCEGGVLQHFVPLFDDYQVDLVVNGHNHIYERTDPLRGGLVSAPAPVGASVRPATAGTTYITAGGAGKSLYQFSAADSYAHHSDEVDSVVTFSNGPDGHASAEHVSWSRVRYTGYCLLVVDSRPSQAGRSSQSELLVRCLAEDGTELDRIELIR